MALANLRRQPPSVAVFCTLVKNRGILNGQIQMLKHIPFYASLLGREMTDGKKSNNGMVLVYGAIEVHAMGDKGCIASNGRIAEETGLSAGTVANYISLMNKSKWVRVTLNKDRTSRVLIVPLLTIEVPSSTSDTLHTSVIPPSSPDEPPLHTQMNRDYSIGNNENTHIAKAIGETPVYGKLELNELFDYWETATGIGIASKRQPNRNACNNLYRKYQSDGVKKLIDGVALAQADPFAPRISDFCDLQNKLTQLLVWGKNNGNKTNSVVVIS